MTHILVAVSAFDAERGGGSVRLAYDLATGLAHRGHQVTVVCEDLFGRGLERELDSGMTILRYQLARSDRLGLRRHKEHMRAVKDLTTRYLTYPPEVVHGHHIFQYTAVLDLFRSQSHCCYSIHSPAIDELRITWGAQGLAGKLKSLLGLSIIRKLEASLLQQSSALAAESAYTTSLIARHYGDAVARTIHVIPGWADTAQFQVLGKHQINQARQQLDWPILVPVFFVLRRLEPRMGLDNLLEAVRIVKEQGFDLRIFIGGDGSLKPQLVELRDALGLQNTVTFMGFVPAAQLPLAYGACDATIVPTAQLECFGLIALESLACGKPTLVTPVGALPEVIMNFEPEWIARGSTPAGIADLLVAFLEDRLPIHSPQELHNGVKRTYGFEQALVAYERLLL